MTKGGTDMGAIFVSIIKNVLEAAVYVVIAWAGIMLGKNVKARKTGK